MTPANETEVATPEAAEDRGRLAAATDRVRETANAASTRANEAYSAARDKTREAYDTARDRATDAYEVTRDGIDSNPVAALVGGLAIGAVLAAVLPATRREAQLLGDAGKRLNKGIRDAAKSAKQTGLGKLDEFGVNTFKEKLGELAGGKKAGK